LNSTLLIGEKELESTILQYENNIKILGNNIVKYTSMLSELNTKLNGYNLTEVMKEDIKADISKSTILRNVAMSQVVDSKVKVQAYINTLHEAQKEISKNYKRISVIDKKLTAFGDQIDMLEIAFGASLSEIHKAVEAEGLISITKFNLGSNLSRNAGGSEPYKVLVNKTLARLASKEILPNSILNSVALSLSEEEHFFLNLFQNMELSIRPINFGTLNIYGKYGLELMRFYMPKLMNLLMELEGNTDLKEFSNKVIFDSGEIFDKNDKDKKGNIYITFTDIYRHELLKIEDDYEIEVVPTIEVNIRGMEFKTALMESQRMAKEEIDSDEEESRASFYARLINKVTYYGDDSINRQVMESEQEELREIGLMFGFENQDEEDKLMARARNLKGNKNIIDRDYDREEDENKEEQMGNMLERAKLLMNGKGINFDISNIEEYDDDDENEDYQNDPYNEIIEENPSSAEEY